MGASPMVPIASLVRDELEKKRAELARLKLRLVRRERELARLRAELPEFEAAYLRVVGFRIAELERIEAHIAEAVAEIRPNGASAGGNDSNRGRTNDSGEVAVRAPRIVRRGGSARVTTLNFEPNRGYSLLHLDVTHCNVFQGIDDELIVASRGQPDTATLLTRMATARVNPPLALRLERLDPILEETMKPRTILAAMLSVLFVVATAQPDRLICPTLPGTGVRDYGKPCYREDGNHLYPTLPGTALRDGTQPGWRAEGKEIFPTLPGTSIRDFGRSGWRADGDVVHPTVPGTGFRDYAKPGWRSRGSEMFPTLPGTGIRDYGKPGWRTNGNLICPTLPGTGIRDYGKPCFRADPR